MTDRHSATSGLLDDIWKMTRRWEHVEVCDDGRRHRSTHDSLIDQLRSAAAHSSPTHDEGGSGVKGSRPPVVEEPFEVLLAVEVEVKRIVVDTLAQRPRRDVEGNLSLIAGNLKPLSDDDLTDVSVRVGALRHRAEAALSWRYHARRIRGRCPECSRNGTVLVHLDDHGPADAFCVGCKTQWPRERLGVLAGAMEG
jgi:hypothetical protein